GAFGSLALYRTMKNAKTKSQQNKRCDYRVTSTMKDETNREIKWVAIVTTFFVLASLSSATAQRPLPAPRSQLQDFSAEVFEGPTPFIRFVHTNVDDISGFSFAQFLIFPKPGSATRPIKVHYGRSYLEARGYFDSQTGK